MLGGSTIGLWAAVALSGIFHGVSPGMGWPLAVSAGLMGPGRRNLFAALGALAGGHLLAMATVLLPFAVLGVLADWQNEIRLVLGSAVLCAGLYLLLARRHPRFLARIGPGRLVLWSFAIAIVHGAGLMLVPAYLGLCSAGASGSGDAAAGVLMNRSLAMALVVAIAHTFAMLASGGALAFATYEWFGPKAIARSWFNFEAAWAFGLMAVGAAVLWKAGAHPV